MNKDENNITQLVQEKLKKNEFDSASITKFRSEIKKTDAQEANNLGLEIIKLLKNINYCDVTGYDVILKLIKDGANVNYTASGFDSALMMCVQTKNIYSVANLLRAGANVNYQNYNDQTALMYAAINNDAFLFEKLILMGADISIKDIYSRTAYDYAVGFEDSFIELTKNMSSVISSNDTSSFIIASSLEKPNEKIVKESFDEIVAGASKQMEEILGNSYIKKLNR